jgi:hypothetical protein
VLTDEQRSLIAELYPDGAIKSGDQTPLQAENGTVRAAQEACELEGIGVPAEEDIRAALQAAG